MRGLREKLKEIKTAQIDCDKKNDIATEDQEIKFFPRSELEKVEFGLEEKLNGCWINTAAGDIFRAEYIQSLNEIYGNIDISAVHDLDSRAFAEIYDLPDSGCSVEDLLFIDTETTGLSNTGGTLAFLVGLAWVDKMNFVVHQYFVDQPIHEEGMLELLAVEMDRRPVLVSFNGKSYDLPLLRHRFIMNRLPVPEGTRAHIDLLHASRALWKYRLSNCRLSRLEEEVLGLKRHEDIPGELIPGIYFDYLRQNKKELLEQVFIHNRYDMISLLALLIEIYRLNGRDPDVKDALVNYARARIDLRKDRPGRGVKFFQEVLRSDISPGRRQRVMVELAAVHKKEKELEKAVSIWEELTELSNSFCLEAGVELAKYHEHKSGNLNKALKTTEKLIEALPAYLENRRGELLHRSKRIRRKLQKHEKHKKR